MRRAAWLAGALLAIHVGSAAAALGDWAQYKKRFLAGDGRIVDTGNAGISHSEGQGVGMLLAVAHDDREAFRRIWAWTRDNLALRDDGLFAWRYEPDRANPTADLSNATDGDVMIAWALTRAAARWDDRTYRQVAAGLARTLRERVVSQSGSETLLLPGVGWAKRGDHAVVNLSYWVLPAFQEFASIDPSPIWEQMIRTGTALISRARFGRWDLPADWMSVRDDGTLGSLEDFPFVFGYEAVRIPLYYLWAGFSRRDVLRIYQAFWAATARGERLVTMLGLGSDSILQQERVLGHQAVRSLVDCAISERPAALLESGFADYDDYYSATMLMLAQRVVEERMPQCVQHAAATAATTEGCGPAGCAVADPVPGHIEPTLPAARVVDWLQVPSTRAHRPLADLEALVATPDGALLLAQREGTVLRVHGDPPAAQVFLDLRQALGDRLLYDETGLGLVALGVHPDYALASAPGHGAIYTLHAERVPAQHAAWMAARLTSPVPGVHHHDVVTEWRVHADGHRIDPASAREVLRIEQPHAGHDAAVLAFRSAVSASHPDRGLLFIGVGDGGHADSEPEDPYRQAQNPASALGTVLRIDPRPGSSTPGHAVPADNPFAAGGAGLAEVWAYGLRAPRGIAWEPGDDGRMLIADSGGAALQEINLGRAGANYGWGDRLGRFAVHPDRPGVLATLPGDDALRGFTYPLFQYDGDEGIAIAGGWIYTGSALPWLTGRYVFADATRGRVFAARLPARGATTAQEPIQEIPLRYNGADVRMLDILNGDVDAALRLGVDARGEIYLVSSRDGTVRRLTPGTFGIPK